MKPQSGHPCPAALASIPSASIAYIPRIDRERRQAIVVNRYPGAKVCARISVRPLHMALRSFLPTTTRTVNHP